MYMFNEYNSSLAYSFDKSIFVKKDTYQVGKVSQYNQEMYNFNAVNISRYFLLNEK